MDRQWFVGEDGTRAGPDSDADVVPRRLYSSAMPQAKDLLSNYQLNELPTLLPARIANDMLENYTSERNLTDERISLFSKDRCNLTIATICRQSVTADGLRVLGRHTLKLVHLHELAVSLSDVIDDSILSNGTQAACISLRISSCSTDRECDAAPFRKIALLFRNMHTLNLSNTSMGDYGLAELCKNLTPTLSALDISRNILISDITPVRLLKHSLKSFKMHDLARIADRSLIDLIVDLQLLTCLDVSLNMYKLGFDGTFQLPLDAILSRQDCLKYIKSLDITTRFSTFNLSVISEFLKSHPYMEFLGLTWENLKWQGWFRVDGEQISIAGLGTENRLIHAIHHYKENDYYLNRLMNQMIRIFESHDQPYPSIPRYDIISAVLSALHEHPSGLSTFASLCCLKTLTKGDLIQKIHPECLNSIVWHLIYLLEHNSGVSSMVEYALKILSKQRILSEITFDFCRCTKAILRFFQNRQWEINCYEPCFFRGMKVIIGIVKKIDFVARAQLATRSDIEGILRVISQNSGRVSTASGLRILFSFLQILTEDSPSACDWFTQHGGVDVTLQYLRVYAATGDEEDADKIPILCACAAILTRLVEDDSKKGLLTTEFLQFLDKSLTTPYLEYNFHCGGIASNLLTGAKNLGHLQPYADDLNARMMQVIPLWTRERELCSYSSFQRFVPMLTENVYTAPRLWALWTMEHMTILNPVRYLPMLDTIMFLVELSLGEEYPLEIQSVAERLKDVVKENKGLF